MTGREREGESAERERRRLRALTEAAVGIGTELDAQVLLQRIADAARDLIGTQYAALGIWEGGEITQFVHSGIDAQTVARIGSPPRGKGLLGAVRSGETIRLRDISADPRSYGFPPGHPPMRSFLGVPVSLRDAVYGDLYLTEKLDGEEFSEEDEVLAKSLATLAGVAMENARLFALERETVERLRELDRLRADFVSMVSHELRNPLASVRGFAQLLQERGESLSRDERAEFTAAIVRQSDRLSALVDDVLDVSRLESGEFSYGFTEYSPQELVEEAVGEAQAAATAHTFRTEAPDRLPTVRGDRDRTKQVLANLLQNAARYSREGTKVTVSVRRDGEWIEYAVADEGIGIASHDIPRLFERFFRIRRPGKDPGGTGLGLYISRRIVEAHGGSIDVESKPGRGSTFRVRLPISPE